MGDVAEKIINGEIRSVARLIRDIDDGLPEVRETMKELYPHTGKAYVVGITGAPGVGKSTLVDAVIGSLRERGKTVGVLAVDPTSPFSGGAILGDRIRMQRHSTDPGVFIRSLATRGQFGGLTQSTRYAIDVLDAMGKDFIIVETVGVGQDEVDIVKEAHTTVILVVPGMGDDIQAIKAGILEVGEIFVINKSDHPGAEKTENDLRAMIALGNRDNRKNEWEPSIIKTEALFNKGISELLAEIDKHSEYLRKISSSEGASKKKERIRILLRDMVTNRLMEIFSSQLVQDIHFEEAVESIYLGRTDPYTACDKLLLSQDFQP
ncbi:MAG: methylmalonyl Co-A mutase-associated GTPase MeaB [Deltaproteobacteria bacterium]|nr:methylmalonyl Co-A mutase-associated GTPase MeaB [Deltaproteobacteria bacterium]